jgi:hypothetical protein
MTILEPPANMEMPQEEVDMLLWFIHENRPAWNSLVSESGFHVAKSMLPVQRLHDAFTLATGKQHPTNGAAPIRDKRTP